MKQMMFVCLTVVLFACQKKESGVTAAAQAVEKLAPPDCAKEIITGKPVKVGQTGMVLPEGTKLCFSKDELEIRVELPEGYNFVSNKTLPIYATYSCNCSMSGSACKVFYSDGLGFGCLQSSCSGSCTGKFTYAGYSVDRIISSRSELFSIPEVQKEIRQIRCTDAYCKYSVYDVSFYMVNDEAKFLAAASCNCEGTQACKMKKISIPFVITIYICEGTCNGCELTV